MVQDNRRRQTAARERSAYPNQATKPKLRPNATPRANAQPRTGLSTRPAPGMFGRAVSDAAKKLFG
jgi:hypothetical protein